MGGPGRFPERMPPTPHFASNGMPLESGVNIDGFLRCYGASGAGPHK